MTKSKPAPKKTPLGRKPKDGVYGKRYQVILDDTTHATCRRIGDGDVSVGIRRLAHTVSRLA